MAMVRDLLLTLLWLACIVPALSRISAVPPAEKLPQRASTSRSSITSNIAYDAKMSHKIHLTPKGLGLEGSLASIRGGIVKGKEKKQTPGMVGKALEVFNSIPLVNRRYLTLILACTAVAMTGLPADQLFALRASRLIEIWRPFTSIAFFGTPSISMANSIYFLLRYGQTLEAQDGPASYAYFLATQTAMLTVLALLLGFPFTSQAMISAIIYVCSRINPTERLPFQFGLTITSWQLPFCLLILDCLSQQSAAAAWPHVLGILSGHTFHFFRRVWPKLGGKKRFETPALFTRYLERKPGGASTSTAKSRGRKTKS